MANKPKSKAAKDAATAKSAGKKPPVPVAKQPVSATRPGWMGNRPGAAPGGRPAPGLPPGARVVPRGAVGGVGAMPPPRGTMAHRAAPAPTVRQGAETMTSTVSSGPSPAGLFGGRRGPRFYRQVRRGVARELTKEGYDFRDAREAAEEMTNDEIDRLADRQGIQAEIGDRGFFDWLIEHLPQILELIKLIVGIIGMFPMKHSELKSSMKGFKFEEEPEDDDRHEAEDTEDDEEPEDEDEE